MRKKYQSTSSKSEEKLEVISSRELVMRLPLPLVEVQEELQAQVEQLAGKRGCGFCTASWRTK